MKARFQAKITFAVTLLLATGSVVAFSPLGPFKTTRQAALVVGGSQYSTAATSTVVAESVAWVAPQPQARDSAWTYEVFTPPEIYYDASTRQFSVTPQREAESVAVASAVGCALELLEVKRVPFRLQLVGYIGEEGNYLGAFENTETTELFLARAGKSLPDLGLSITAFEVKRERGLLADGLPANEPVAVATVHDDRSESEIMLTHLERSYTDRLRARFYRAMDRADESEAGEGDVIEADGVRYVVEKLHLAPPMVEVRRETVGASVAERHTLAVAAPPLP